MYTNIAKELLDRYGITPGDRVRISVSFPPHPHHDDVLGRTFECIILDKGSRSRKENIIVKLSNGYNLSLDTRSIKGMDLIERYHTPKSSIIKEATGNDGKKIVLIGTGGTIASMVDYRTGGVHPAMTPEDMNEAVPELSGICELEMTIASSILSEDVSVQHWDEYTKRVQDAFTSGANGVIIAHGTDTLASTSAALSFTIQHPPGPVILVGSQRSSDRPSSDSRLNLKHSLLVAVSDIPGGVYVVMHASINDGPSIVHLGTKVRKMHSTRRDAFMSVNRLPVGAVIDDALKILDPPKVKAENMKVKPGFDEKVLFISSQVGDLGPVLGLVQSDYDGLIIAGSGLGHINSKYLDQIKELVRTGKPVVMTTDCINGSTDLDVYSTGRDLKDAGVIPAGDMIPHVAHIKAMWLLSELRDTEATKRVARFRELFLSDVAGELSDRRVIGSFGQDYLQTLKDLGVK